MNFTNACSPLPYVSVVANLDVLFSSVLLISSVYLHCISVLYSFSPLYGTSDKEFSMKYTC